MPFDFNSLGRFLPGRPRVGAAGPDSTAGHLVYAVGDIHGRYDLLTVLLARLVDDFPAHARGRRPIVIFCGDYIDRGPQSVEVIEALIWLQRHAELDVRLLRGNHEQSLLDFLQAPQAGAPWLANGGAATLVSYGVRPPAEESPDPLELARVRNDLLAALPAAHLWLLESLELLVAVGDYAFVHAGIRPGKRLAEQSQRDLLWIREPFTGAPGPFEKIVVHGHSWRGPTPEVLDHRIGLDTGAYETGVLTAIRLDGPQREVIQARDAASADWNPWTRPAPRTAPRAAAS